MRERWLTSRPRTQTSSPLAGRGEGTPCTTSCRAPPTPRDESCPSPCLCPSCTSTLEGEMETTPRTAGSPPPRPRGRRRRGTANLLDAPAGVRRAAASTPAAVSKALLQCELVTGG